MTAPRPTAFIRHELETALAYQQLSSGRPSSNPFVSMMRRANEREIQSLGAELAVATAGNLELTLVGNPYLENRVSVPYITRVLEGLQSTFRATCKAIAPAGGLRRSEATLSLIATAPGSFKVLVMTPAAQLELLEPPVVDRALDSIIDILSTAEQGTAAADIPQWVAQSDESVVRSMIRFSVRARWLSGDRHGQVERS